MIWLTLALLTAVCTAAKEALIKGAMRGTSEYAIVFWIALFTAVVLAPAAYATGDGVPSAAFWPALAVSGGINVVAALLIARALHRSDISLVSPLQSLTPLLMLATSPLILAEWAGPLGIGGVAAITAGSYVLASSAVGAHPAKPFAAILHDSGARLMVVVAFLFSISANVDKVGVLASDPLTWAAAVHGLVALALLPRVVADGRRREPDGHHRRPAGRRGPILVLLGGAAAAIAAAAQMTALTFTLAAYVIAVKRTSILFAVLAGGLVFRETGIRARLAGAALMAAGVLLIAWR